MDKISDFTDLIVWKKGHQLVLDIYKTTELFSSKERFGLVSQMQRAAVSITSNIAEGFARRSKKEKVQFYFTSLASLAELRSQLIICKDIKYINEKSFNIFEEQAVEIRKLLNGLIKSSNNY